MEKKMEVESRKFKAGILIYIIHIFNLIIGLIGILVSLFKLDISFRIYFFGILSVIGILGIILSKFISPIKIDSKGIELKNIFGKTIKSAKWIDISRVDLFDNRIKLILQNDDELIVSLISIKVSEREELLSIIRSLMDSEVEENM
jgi:hypothetical protein